MERFEIPSECEKKQLLCTNRHDTTTPGPFQASLYLVEHESIKGQTERYHQEKEQHYNTDERLHDFPKHHNIDADTLKPAKGENAAQWIPNLEKRKKKTKSKVDSTSADTEEVQSKNSKLPSLRPASVRSLPH